MKVEEFYNLISSEYTEMLERLVPRYREMLWMILDYIPKDLRPKRILDLGCGTGNLLEGLVQQYPDSMIQAVDISPSILEEAESRFNKSPQIDFINGDFNTIEFESGSIDLIVSSIALHHLTDEQKVKVLQKIYSWLSPDGVLIIGDQFAGNTTQQYQQHLENWKQFSMDKNVPLKEWELWMDHQDKHDFHSPIEKYFEWSKQIGFHNVDVVWRYLLWSVFIAHKKSSK